MDSEDAWARLILQTAGMIGTVAGIVFVVRGIVAGSGYWFLVPTGALLIVLSMVLGDRGHRR